MTNLNSARSRAADQTAKTNEEEGLTLGARRALAETAVLAALHQYIRLVVGGANGERDWIDQHDSPLGKRAHLEAVRSGKLRGVKHGRRVLVRRAELNSFLENHSVKHHAVRNAAGDVIDGARANQVAAAVLTHVGLRLRKG